MPTNIDTSAVSTLGAAPGAVIQIRDLNPAETMAQFVKQHNSVFTTRHTTFIGRTAAHRVVNTHGVRYHVYSNPGIDAGLLTAFRGYLSEVIRLLSHENAHRIRDLRINVYIDSNPGSAGYVVARNPAAERTIELFFGSDLWNANDVRLNTGIVANYIYVNTPGAPAEKFRRRAIAAIIHEFGHVFHQLHSPAHYFGLSTVTVYKGKADSELNLPALPVARHTRNPFRRAEVAAQNAAAQSTYDQEYAFVTRLREQRAIFDDLPPPSRIKTFHDSLVAYVRAHLGPYASEREPEVVAEVYAAKMMGITLDANMNTLYTQFGGMEPRARTRFAAAAIGTVEDLMDAWVHR